MVHKANAQMNRRLLWDDLFVYLKGKPRRGSVSQERSDDVLRENIKSVNSSDLRI